MAQVLRENNLSVLEILKVAVAASLEFPADVQSSPLLFVRIHFSELDGLHGQGC